MLALSATPSLIERTSQQMLVAIAGGTLMRGQRVRQAELADALGISRQVVSQAPHLLKRQGLVEAVSRKRLRVVPLYQVRDAVDGLTARLAAEKLQLKAA